MTGWEMVGAFFGGVGTSLIAVILKDIFFRGRQSAALIHLSKDVNALINDVKQTNDKIASMDKQLSEHKEKFLGVDRMHNSLDASIENLEHTNSKILQQLASSDATMRGVQMLLERLLDGKIVIAKRA